jgi:hypothetical protein
MIGPKKKVRPFGVKTVNISGRIAAVIIRVTSSRLPKKEAVESKAPADSRGLFE